MKIRDDLKQRHLEKFESLVFALPEEERDKMMGGQGRGHNLRCAIAAGWFGDSADPDSVSELPANEAKALAIEVAELYRGLMSVDPN